MHSRTAARRVNATEPFRMRAAVCESRRLSILCSMLARTSKLHRCACSNSEMSRSTTPGSRRSMV